jgi:hypothetical protein
MVLALVNFWKSGNHTKPYNKLCRSLSNQSTSADFRSVWKMNISTIFFSQDHRMFNFLLIALNRNSDFLKSKQSRHSRQSTTYTFLWTELELCTHLLSKSQLFTSNRLTPTQSGWIIIHYCVDPRYWTSSPRWVKANFNQSYGLFAIGNLLELEDFLRSTRSSWIAPLGR